MKLKDLRLMVLETILDMVVDHYKRKADQKQKAHEQAMRDSTNPPKIKEKTE